VAIEFNQAIVVAVLGLIVNGVSVLILGHHDHGDDGHARGHGHGHDHDHSHHHHHDHNLVSAYLHVLADALTSLLAIFALLAAKYFGFIWADPLMGIVGAILVARWSFGLLGSTGVVLLDRQGPDDILERIRQRIEGDGDNRVVDLHVWAIGPKMYSAIVSIVAAEPQDPDYYKALIPGELGIVHTVVEVHPAD
jgi:cation diffusion facilitator family transporter